MEIKKSFFSWTVFKKTILRFWPVWGAYAAIWMVALPLNGLMRLQMDANASSETNMLAFAQGFVPGLCSASLIFAVGFGLLAAMAVCSHLYNSRSANFFGSLPVRREGLFLTHYLAGLAFLIVPNAAVFLLTLLVEAAGGALYLNGLLFWLGVTCGECLFFYSMAVFCGMFTGHILAQPAFYAIFNALAYALYYLLDWMFRSFYYGFNGFEQGTTVFVAWLTPVFKLIQDVRGSVNVYDAGRIVEGGPRGLGTVAAYAAAAVLLAAGAFLLYRVRRLESAGDVVSVKCMRPVFKYGVSVCAGLFLGMLTAQFVYMHEPGMMISMLVWAVVGYFAAQMLLDKSFRVFRKWKGAAAVAGAFLLMFLVVGLDLTGYETRVPDADQVDYVDLGGIDAAWLGDNSDYLGAMESDPEIIDLAVLLHRAAVDQRGVPPDGNQRTMSLRVIYHLKNGSTLSRRYGTLWIDPAQKGQEGTAAWAVQRIYDDRDLYWREYGFEDAERLITEEGFWVGEADYEYYNEEKDYENGYFYGEDARALYEAVKEDFKAGRIGVRAVDGAKETDGSRRNLQFQIVNGDNRGFHWINIRVQETSTSTLAVLARLKEEGAGEYHSTSVQREEVLEDGTVVAYPTVSMGPEPALPTAEPVDTAAPSAVVD